MKATPPTAVALPTSVLGKVGVTLGASLLSGAVLLGARHLWRVWTARWKLQTLLAAVAGEDARVVITGATSGIGEELARQLLRHPSVTVLLGCRDIARAERIFRRYGVQRVGRLASATEETDEAPCRVRLMALELLDFDFVQAFTDEAHAFLHQGEAGLRMLVNNAGVMNPPAAQRPGAFDATWLTNFLSPFLLTELLGRHRQFAAKKQRTPLQPVRIVHVGSRLEQCSRLDEEVLEQVKQNSVGEHTYSDTKRAIMLWTSSRAQALAFKSNLYVHVATPGMVDTQLGRYAVQPWLWPLTKPLRWLMMKAPAEGALGIATCGLQAQATSAFGRYYDGSTMLEDTVLERMGQKRLAQDLVKWASEKTALEVRFEGYDK
eukprot:TRINITY_DN9089_c0_g1_i1.p1 TRINITY_DN9089_c0_g1~~TRINITY_DN9089_c0_g1_i1.p1  ORF type:complete len:377 (-),score=87.77 TRINITY_DN9089_c0_g1_i1:377-1507(-)